MLRRSPATVEAIATTAAIAGAIGGLAGGAIDALWSWDRLGQFVVGGGKVRALLYLSVSYACAALLVAPLVALGGTLLARATRLGDLGRALGDAHARAPLARLSLAIAMLPAIGMTLALVHVAITPTLATRKHFGLVVVVAMGATLAALVAGVVLGFVLARGLELVLEAIARGPRRRRALASPTAALVAILVVLVATAAVIAWRAWSTVSLLSLRPLLVALLLVVLAIALRRPAAALASRLRDLGKNARPIVVAAGFGVLAVFTLVLGSSDGPRKAATAHSGLGGPITRAARVFFDLDRDGYSRVLGGGDCDDWNDAINPGAPEIPEDGIDNNCVGGDVVLTRDVADVGFTTVTDKLPPDFNVILITIDTIRADHLGAYGYKRATSPTLDALAADGTLFENGWAHAPSTRYSIPAILTGRLPLAVEYFPIAGAWPGLADANDTIAEVLKARGFETGAILNYWYFEERRKMTQGFDHYDNKNRILHSAVKGKGPAQTKGSSSKEQTDKALAFIDERGERRFFLWVHYYDPHYAYEKHPGTTDFGNGRVALYDQEIRYTDDNIGRLIADLKRRGLYERTVIVATGDHGEGFGEHGIDLHGYHLYAAQTKVPLIIRVPGTQPRRVTTPASHVDILPTLANLAGAPATETMDGRSLVDLIEGQSSAPKDRVVFQQLSFENNNEMRGAASSDCHVIFNVSPHRSWETYEIATDPDETRDVPDSSRCRPVRRALESFYDRSEIPRDAKSALLGARPAIAKPLTVDFDGHAQLLEVALPADARRGETVPIAFTWAAGRGFDEAWKVFVHLEGPRKAFLQADHQPARPTTWWQDGQFIRYERPLTIPRGRTPGTYRVYVGLFRGDERHPVSAGGAAQTSGRAFVGTLKILGAPRP